MSEPIYEQVTNEVLVNQLFHNLERYQQLTREIERVNEQFRKARIELRNFETERKALLDAVGEAVAYIGLTIDVEPVKE